MIDIIFTIDYEIYGDGSGPLKELVYEPAQRLKDLFQSYNARFVAFVEIAEFRKIHAFRTDPAIDLVTRQIHDLHRDGFEIGLHLHPQWSNARFVDGRWLLDSSEYNLCSLPKKRIAEIVDESLAFLRQVVEQPDLTPLSFRAGNWLFQPTERAASVLLERGIKIDSSVFKGGLQRNHGLDYRRALKNDFYWRFNCDVNVPDPAGMWIEVPIYSDMVPFWRMITRKRLSLPNTYEQSNRKFDERVTRALDLARFLYPLKLDFCRMTFGELTSMVDRIIRQDREDPESYRPLVAIGHSKDLWDFETVDSFLSFLKSRQINVSTFSEIYPNFGRATAKSHKLDGYLVQTASVQAVGTVLGHSAQSDLMERTHVQDRAGESVSACVVSEVPENDTSILPGALPSYILVSPARNEAAFIEKTIRSVIAQTILPLRWVIVSDGSTDGTDDIVKKYLTDYPWIELVRMPERRERHFAGKVHAFNAGWARVKDLPYDLIGNLDTDVSFEPDYFEFLLQKFVENPKLGVGGTPFREGSFQYDYRFTSIEHVSGQIQLFRRRCFEDIGGYVPRELGGIDLVAVISARMKGWQTRCFLGETYEHLRLMGSAAQLGRVRGAFWDGQRDYALGCGPLWQLSRCAYHSVARQPFLLEGTLRVGGFFWAMLRRKKIAVPIEIVQFRKAEQRRRLRDLTKRVLLFRPMQTPVAKPSNGAHIDRGRY